MKIGLAQIQSFKGEIEKNIERHVLFIQKAIHLQCDIIVFPELSITNYEPALAKDYATDIEDKIFNPFLALAAKHKITICVGMPRASENGILISMFIFKANTEKSVYNKTLLHEDEVPFFSSGNCEPILTINNKKLGLGICFESLHKAHLKKTIDLKATHFIASVSKSDSGIDKAYRYFQWASKEFDIPILMVNAVGAADDFMAKGHSTIWNKKGEIIGQLNAAEEALLIYDTELETTQKEYTNTNEF